MNVLKTYIDDLFIDKLDVDFQAERKRRITESRNDVDKQLDEIDDMISEYELSVPWDKIDWEDVFTTGQKSHIERFMEKGGLELDDALNMLFIDSPRPVAYYVLGKDAEKTGYQEQYQFDILRKSAFFDDSSWKILPRRGKDARYLGENGTCVSRDSRSKSLKSLDFTGLVHLPVAIDDDSGYSFEYQLGEKVPLHIAAKYTQGQGGGQDNQAADLESFAKFAAEYGYGNPITVLLTDGDYYAKATRDKHDQMKFDDYIMDQYPNKNLIVTSSELFDIALANFLLQLLVDDMEKA